jgi:hypothetical protein
MGIKLINEYGVEVESFYDDKQTLSYHALEFENSRLNNKIKNLEQYILQLQNNLDSARK